MSMAGTTVAVLDASYGHLHTRRNFRRELAARTVEFDVTDGHLPETLDVDGVVVTGSRSSVYWDEPWITATKAVVGEAISSDIPVLGICWGHQLLAEVLGGTVEPMGTYEIGYRHIKKCGTSRLLAGIEPEFLAFTTHSDAVTTVPPGCRVIAKNDTAIQGIAGEGVFGVQFHPEYDMDTARNVTEEKDDLDPDLKQEALASITPGNYRAAAPAKLVFENFLSTLSGA